MCSQYSCSTKGKRGPFIVINGKCQVFRPRSTRGSVGQYIAPSLLALVPGTPSAISTWPTRPKPKPKPSLKPPSIRGHDAMSSRNDLIKTPKQNQGDDLNHKDPCWRWRHCHRSTQMLSKRDSTPMMRRAAASVTDMQRRSCHRGSAPASRIAKTPKLVLLLV